jgi:hypothetical protein
MRTPPTATSDLDGRRDDSALTNGRLPHPTWPTGPPALVRIPVTPEQAHELTMLRRSPGASSPSTQSWPPARSSTSPQPFVGSTGHGHFPSSRGLTGQARCTSRGRCVPVLLGGCRDYSVYDRRDGTALWRLSTAAILRRPPILRNLASRPRRCRGAGRPRVINAILEGARCVMPPIRGVPAAPLGDRAMPDSALGFCPLSARRRIDSPLAPA